MRLRAGFSLTELLIVLAIIGVVAAGAGLGLGLLHRAQLTESLNVVETQLAQARRLAKRLDEDVTFEVYQNDGVWQVAVNGRAKALPASANVATGTVEVTLLAPFGTYDGSQFDIELAIRGVNATVTVTGVLARTVVTR